MSTTATGIREARRKLVVEHLQLVRQLTRRVRFQLDLGLPEDDLEAYGREALVRASRRWDPRRGVPFGAYARQRIHGAILDGVAELGGVPRRLYRRLRFDRAASDLLGGWTGAAGAGADAGELREVLQTAYLLASEGASDWGTAAACHEGQTGEQLVRARIVGAVQGLPERERDLLLGIYWEGRSCADAGRQVSVSPSYATRLHRATLRRLRLALGLGPVS